MYIARHAIYMTAISLCIKSVPVEYYYPVGPYQNSACMCESNGVFVPIHCNYVSWEDVRIMLPTGAVFPY